MSRLALPAYRSVRSLHCPAASCSLIHIIHRYTRASCPIHRPDGAGASASSPADRPAGDSSSRAATSSGVCGGERIAVDAVALWDGDDLHGDLPLQPRDYVVVPAAEAFVTAEYDALTRTEEVDLWDEL